MRIAIIDDEKLWIEIAQKIINDFYGKDELEIYTFTSGEQFLEKKMQFDVAFVDIEMGGINGFETIKEARAFNDQCIFIILTTHTDMSRRGYLFNAFRYIDKINMDEELQEALHTVNCLLELNIDVEINVVGEGQQKIRLKNIVYIETDKHCIIIHTKQGEIKSNDSMQGIEEILNEKCFFRCHRCYIVNLDEVESYSSTEVHLENGETLCMSRRRFMEFKRKYLRRKCECANA